MAVPRTVVLRGETQWRISGVGKVHGAPECRGAEFQAKLKKKQICRFWAVDCTKMCLAAGLHPNPLGELERSPRLHSC